MGQRIITHRGPNETLAPALQDLTELALYSTADTDDKQGVYVEDENSLYFYDLQSALAESLPDIVAPTGGVGRWIRHGYLAGGSPSELYRRKWWQPQVLDTGDDVVIEEDNELIISTLDVDDGTFTVDGQLIIYSNGTGTWRSRFSQPMYIGPDEGHAIPRGDHLLVVGEFTVDGSLDVRGDLFFLTV